MNIQASRLKWLAAGITQEGSEDPYDWYKKAIILFLFRAIFLIIFNINIDITIAVFLIDVPLLGLHGRNWFHCLINNHIKDGAHILDFCGTVLVL